MIKEEIKGIINQLTDEEIISICEYPSRVILQLLENNALSLDTMQHLLKGIKTKKITKDNYKKNISDINIVRIKLNPDAKTYQKINLIFSTLSDISKLLNSSTKNINSKEEAKLYLLTQFRDLMALSDSTNRDAFIDQLNQFIPYWLTHRNAPTSLQIEGRIVPIREMPFIKINGFKNIPIEIPQKPRISSLKKVKFLNLIKIDDNFIIEINNQHRKNYKETTKNPQEAIKRKTIRSKRINNKNNHTNTPYILKRMEEYLRFAERINRAFVKPDFDKLEGWHTQGGLPTLGKRR